MIIYNVTILVDWTISDKWLQWMKEVHIPLVLATGCFESYRLVRLLQIDETAGPTYAVQYMTASLTLYDKYILQHAAALKKQLAELWGDSYTDFRTLMEEVN